MIERIAYETKSYGIELPDGTELLLPERNDEIYEKFNSLEGSKTSRTEYEHYQAVLELLFGRDGFKKIAPKGKKESLDYLARVYVISVGLFTKEKQELEQQELEKQAERIAPITSKAEQLSVLLKQGH